jgi:selenocysteine-specific elongation factor
MSLKLKKPDILPVMAGTAGHVDHGKSTLVKLLTGCEMDRRPEEKARGLTIDLGFAPCLLPGNRCVGIVDVPGHEDFIRNMVAGAASIDVLILVVAADDGVMPQTVEHLQIVRLLRTPKVMVCVTKIDLVEPDMRELVREDIRSFLLKAGFADAPVVLTSAVTFDGIQEARTVLQQLVESVQRPRTRAPSA